MRAPTLFVFAILAAGCPLLGRAATLTLPDGTTLTLPPGLGGDGESFDHLPFPSAPPSSRTREPEPSPPPSPDAEASKPPAGTPAERRQERLDDLFARLAAAQDQPEAEALSASINRIWLQSGSPTADLLMQRASTALADKDTTTAQALLDKLLVLRPGWAEAWNKRATARFLADDDRGSMEDIAHVLALEPRHFGALSGMGIILHRNGQDKAALAVLRRALAVDPQQPDIRALVDQLAPDVEGHDV